MLQPSLSFQSAALKIIWAQQHISNLEQSQTAWIATKPYTVSFETDADTGEHHVKVGLAEAIPSYFPLVIGDICANLRASLDFAWMGLVRAANPGNPARKTFPIADNIKGLESTIKQAPIGNALPQALTLLRDSVRSHRDFQSGGNVALVALNDLSNWNKHNMLILSAGVTRLTNVRMGGVSIQSLNVQGNVATPVAFGCGLPKPDLEYDGEPTVEIVFGHHDFVSNEPVVPALLQLSQMCIEVLKSFCEAFPNERNPTFT